MEICINGTRNVEYRVKFSGSDFTLSWQVAAKKTGRRPFSPAQNVKERGRAGAQRPEITTIQRECK
jgi:hypothetical protein